MEKEKKKSNKTLIIILSIVGLLVLIPIVLLIVVALIFDSFYMEGISMEPTYEDDDYLLINTVVTDFEREDVIVFEYPLDKSKYYIKRIIGLPGEEVEIKEGKVLIDGEVLEEEYIEGETGKDISMVLGDDEYFVLGDNRAASSDSRYWGALKEEDIVGEVAFQLF